MRKFFGTFIILLMALSLSITLAMFCIVTTAAFAQDEHSVKSQAVFGDWTIDAPGVRHLITPDDLPPPQATPFVVNTPQIIAAPADATLHVPDGFKVSAFFKGLKEPRQMIRAPNGDIFVAESGAKRIRILHVKSGNDKPSASIFADHLPERPYGIAFYPPGNDPHYVYVATEGHVLRYPYHAGDRQAHSKPEVIVPDLPQGHHWTRDVIFSPDGQKMYVTIGSGTNDAENGMASEKWRADILEYTPNGKDKHIFGSGLRNPVTLAFNPVGGDLWAIVQERDTLGDNLPPDYATHVVENGFYGWPWYYIGPHQDPRYNGQHPELRDKVIVPDVLFQPHSAALGCAFYTGNQFPAEYKNDLFVALHGSWNRAHRTGYKLVRVRFHNGKATGAYDDFLTGFVTRNGEVWGRPVGVVVAQDGSLLFSDDASGTIWKISYIGTQPK